MSTRFRDSVSGDVDAIVELYPDAFPDEDLVPLVRDLLADMRNVVSLVATVDSQLVGHVMFTRCGISNASAALLGPLAVSPAWQQQGIGSAIVRDGLRRMEEAGVDVVCVLGDPNYYGRFGFIPEPSIAPPYPLPPEWDTAWQSLRTSASTTPITGRLLLPQQWMNPSLWAP